MEGLGGRNDDGVGSSGGGGGRGGGVRGRRWQWMLTLVLVRFCRESSFLGNGKVGLVILAEL